MPSTNPSDKQLQSIPPVREHNEWWAINRMMSQAKEAARATHIAVMNSHIVMEESMSYMKRLKYIDTVMAESMSCMKCLKHASYAVIGVSVLSCAVLLGAVGMRLWKAHSK